MKTGFFVRGVCKKSARAEIYQLACRLELDALTNCADVFGELAILAVDFACVLCKLDSLVYRLVALEGFNFVSQKWSTFAEVML